MTIKSCLVLCVGILCILSFAEAKVICSRIGKKDCVSVQEKNQL
jgi:hypothetical protein